MSWERHIQTEDTDCSSVSGSVFWPDEIPKANRYFGSAFAYLPLKSLVAVGVQLINIPYVEGSHALYIAPTHEQTTKAFEIISILAKDTKLAQSQTGTYPIINREHEHGYDYSIFTDTHGKIRSLINKLKRRIIEAKALVLFTAFGLPWEDTDLTHLTTLDLISLETFRDGLITLLEEAQPYRRILNPSFHAGLQRVRDDCLTILNRQQSIIPSECNRSETIQRIVSECCQNEKVVILVARIKQGESLASSLQGARLSAQATHSMKEMNERLSIAQEFNEGRCRVSITYGPAERWDDFLAAVHKAGLIADGKEVDRMQQHYQSTPTAGSIPARSAQTTYDGINDGRRTGQASRLGVKDLDDLGLAEVVAGHRSELDAPAGAKPRGRGILADACESSKMTTTITMHWYASLYAKRDPTHTHRPRLILCPSPFIDTWLAELRRQRDVELMKARMTPRATTEIVARGFPWYKTWQQIMEMFPLEYSIRGDVQHMLCKQRLPKHLLTPKILPLPKKPTSPCDVWKDGFSISQSLQRTPLT
ncbi:hypothetical protein CNMCM7691_001863 [Aspergillus felis]|uniref:Uncharacterized protein n=1 Tax=Aspergillus felis TaxID=1287682 RepID=A0A8H6V807_9EURO|nr:hypothetical protein CNMCM7691_001863 [Aspergillus felis]